MEKLKNLSIRKTIFIYMLVCLICSFFFSVIVVRVATHVQQRIWFKYIDQQSYFDALNEDGENYMISVMRPRRSIMSRTDYSVSEICDFLETYGILVISVASSCIVVFLFYRDKLKIPLEELSRASKRIAENDLDFQISYKSRDEMGVLCSEFERMRNQLMQNNHILWTNIEEEKILRSAIAHDIRSPLSVLKGYQEMLIEYIPDGTINVENTVEMLSEGMKQINRIDLFVETMRRMNSLEKREFKLTYLPLAELKDDIKLGINILADRAGKKASLEVKDKEKNFYGDKEIILEVTDNVISNALRYAEEEIKIEMRLEEQQLIICIADDGNGFTEDPEVLTKAFHQKNVKDSLEHTGLGMYISRVYCEKHGGKLILENKKQGGARVTAIFGRID